MSIFCSWSVWVDVFAYTKLPHGWTLLLPPASLSLSSKSGTPGILQDLNDWLKTCIKCSVVQAPACCKQGLLCQLWILKALHQTLKILTSRETHVENQLFKYIKLIYVSEAVIRSSDSNWQKDVTLKTTHLKKYLL